MEPLTIYGAGAIIITLLVLILGVIPWTAFAVFGAFFTMARIVD